MSAMQLAALKLNADPQTVQLIEACLAALRSEFDANLEAVKAQVAAVNARIDTMKSDMDCQPAPLDDSLLLTKAKLVKLMQDMGYL